MGREQRIRVAIAVALALAVAGCAAGQDAVAPASPAAVEPTGATDPASPAATAPSPGEDQADAPQQPATTEASPSPTETPPADPRPQWLGTRVLPRRSDGFGEVRPTPKVLRDRRLDSPQHLPDPESPAFTADVVPVPDEVAGRSTWSADCPVRLRDLRYVTLHFWGFDDRAHTGELLVHRDAAEDLVQVFRTLYDQRFPIEEMRIVAPPELDAPPTGDGNNTTAFVCRPSRGSTSWSQHAYGLAVDVNPFHNPYLKGDLVLPELASAYADRERRRPGMITASGPVVAAFDDIGWGWGGRWSSPVDTMHFSANNR